MLKRMLGNWQTTVAGLVVAAGVYLQQNGMTIPTTWAEAKVALLAIAISALGLSSKDATTGSQPGATH